jgi:hypothetical protein
LSRPDIEKTWSPGRFKHRSLRCGHP